MVERENKSLDLATTTTKNKKRTKKPSGLSTTLHKLSICGVSGVRNSKALPMHDPTLTTLH